MKSAVRLTGCCILAGAICVANASETEVAAELEELMAVRVQTASLRKQRLQDAPANVTVISAEDIRRHGYRTLAEVLQNTRSFYTISDGAFTFPGVRGLGLLGDYNMRFLVLLNGHRMTDIVYGAMYMFGEDFPLDMSLVEQIEVVRGPSSALYGSNGLLATINIITRTPKASAPASFMTEAGSWGRTKTSLSTSTPIGKDGALLLAGSVFRTRGRDVLLPGLPEGDNRARNLGNEKGFHTFANLAYKDWNVTAVFGSFRAAISDGWYGAVVGDTGTMDYEGRNFVEAVWSRRLRTNGELIWRGYYDQYRYDGVYRYAEPDRYTSFDGALGDWVGSDITYRHDLNRFGTLTLGAESRYEIRNTQYIKDFYGDLGFDNGLREYPDKAHGIFAQHELKVAPSWSLYIGGRLDNSYRNGTYFSPRLALVANPAKSSYKLMYGRAFRNPSTYERYWTPNPALSAEVIDTAEFVHEHRFGTRARLTSSVYHYRVASLIEGVPISENTLQYRNTAGVGATGAEWELWARAAPWLETTTAFSMQRSRLSESGGRLGNSPVHLGFFHAAVPLRNARSSLSASVRYVGSRLDAYESRLPAFAVTDCTVTTDRFGNGVALQFGVRNLLNQRYLDPMSAEHTPAALPGFGRTWFVNLSWSRE